MIDPVIVGRINALFGTRGWVKVLSYTRPRENLLDYSPWYLRADSGWERHIVREARRHHGGLIAAFAGIADREGAAPLLRRDVAIDRAQLGVPGKGEYYWTDLVGLRVVNLQGEALGEVRGLLETGANDVLQVEGERTRFIPYVPGVHVLEVDLAGGQIRVDWHSDD